MRKPTLGAARQTYKGRKKTRREQVESIILGIEMKFLQEDKDKCGPGEYWCTKDMKCKPIPKGMTTDKDGMLVKEEKMTGQEHRIQMSKVKDKNKKVRQAVSNILDKKKDYGTLKIKNSSHPDIKAAREYMKSEAMVKDPITGKMREKGPSHVTAADINNANSIKGNQERYTKLRKKMFDRSKQGSQNESSDSMDRMADTWNDHADNKHPKVQKHIKKAEKAYNDKDHEGFYHHTQRAADHAHANRSKPKGVTQFDRRSDVSKKKTAQAYSKKYGVNELYPSHNTGTIDMDKHATPEQKKARADHAKKREAFAKKYPNASTSEKMFAKLKSEEVVNELDSKTLKNYIRKAVSPVNKKSAVNLASKGGYRMGAGWAQNGCMCVHVIHGGYRVGTGLVQ